LLLPRVSTLADAAGDIAASQPVVAGTLATELAGLLVFGLAALTLAIWRIEGQDFEPRVPIEGCGPRRGVHRGRSSVR
jgi:hypothetical protein